MTVLDQMLDWQDTCYEEYLDFEEKIIMNDKFTVNKATWEEALNDLNTSARGQWLFPEKGRTKVRILLAPERDPVLFYEKVVTQYFEQPRTRFMFPCLVADDLDNYTYEVKYAVVAKTVIQSILNVLAGGGYDFLHPENGHGVIIIRDGDGLQTRYSALPTKDPIPVDYSAIEWEQELAQTAREFEAQVAKDKAEKEEEDDIPF